eukprot:scaffold283532_cov18-Tisochrysis_lutea.AAC.1
MERQAVALEIWADLSITNERGFHHRPCGLAAQMLKHPIPSCATNIFLKSACSGDAAAKLTGDEEPSAEEVQAFRREH